MVYNCYRIAGNTVHGKLSKQMYVLGAQSGTIIKYCTLMGGYGGNQISWRTAGQ